MAEPIIYDNVQIGRNAIIEPYAIIGIRNRFEPHADTVIGDDSFIGSRCTIYSGVAAGDRFDISDQSTVFFDNIFGDDCRIGPKAVIQTGCRVGSRVRVNAFAFMERVHLGSDIFIGPGSVFTNDRHPPCPQNKACTPATTVGNRVSIGAGVTIGPGLSIGDNCQIYAGATVVADVPAYSVMAGVPARRIGDVRDLVCVPKLMTRPFEKWLEEH